MHWWQAWLGVIGAAVAMSVVWPPQELVKYFTAVLAEMREDKETPWYAKLLVLAGIPVMALAVSGFWLGGFIMFSFAAGWKLSAYIAFIAVATFLLRRWSNRRDQRSQSDAAPRP